MRTHDKLITATIPQARLAAWVIEPALHSDRRQIRVYCAQPPCSLLAIEVIHLFMLIERYWAVCAGKEGRRMESKMRQREKSKRKNHKKNAA